MSLFVQSENVFRQICTDFGTRSVLLCSALWAGWRVRVTVRGSFALRTLPLWPWPLVPTPPSSLTASSTSSWSTVTPSCVSCSSASSSSRSSRAGSEARLCGRGAGVQRPAKSASVADCSPAIAGVCTHTCRRPRKHERLKTHWRKTELVPA